MRAVALGERGEHRAVGVGDLKALRLRAGRQKLVAGDDQPDARLTDDGRVGESDRAHHAKVLRPQRAADLEQRCAAHDVLAALANVLAGRNVGRRGNDVAIPFDGLGRQDRVAAGRHWRAGHDAHGLAARE